MGELRPLKLKGKVNTPREALLANVEANIRLPLPQLHKHDPQDVVTCICGGGPSLAANLESLRVRVEDGAKIVSLNGTHEYLQDQGLEPSIHIQLDARPFNARFVQRPIEGCKYFIASQCDPSVFEALEGHEVYIWHSEFEEESQITECLNEYYRTRWIPVIGGTTVFTRTLPLLWMLGFSKHHVYGVDSCLSNGQHHCYDQPENDQETVNVVCDGEAFACHPWMAKQAQEFMALIKAHGDKWQLNVVGDGLLAHIIKAAASALEEDEVFRIEDDADERIQNRSACTA